MVRLFPRGTDLMTLPVEAPVTLFWFPDLEPHAVAMTITATNPIEIVIPVFISKSPQVRRVKACAHTQCGAHVCTNRLGSLKAASRHTTACLESDQEGEIKKISRRGPWWS